MMHGLEVRTPFTDIKVYEFAARIPCELNFTKVNEKHYQGKALLKKLLVKDMGNDFVNRKKMGFATPITEWFKLEGSYSDEIHERLLSSNSMLIDYFNIPAIERIVRNNQSSQIWLLLFLDEWLRQESAS